MRPPSVWSVSTQLRRTSLGWPMTMCGKRRAMSREAMGRVSAPPWTMMPSKARESIIFSTSALSESSSVSA